MLKRTILATLIILSATVIISGGQTADPARVALETAKKKAVIDGDLPGAIKQYNDIISKYRAQRPVVAEALIRLADVYRKHGDLRARETYQRIVRDFSDQKEAFAEAQARLGEKVFPGWMFQLTWVNRTGDVLETLGPVDMYRGVELSPDETRLAGYRGIRSSNGQLGDVWIGNTRSGMDTRLTTNGPSFMPIWSPGGDRIVFSSLRQGKWGLYVKASNGRGAEELLLESETFKTPSSWAPDGKSIVYWVDERSSDGRRGVLWVLPLEGNRRPVLLLDDPNASNHANAGQISPDGKWIAYHSRETGEHEVYIKPYPSGPGKWKVSGEGGGRYPRWKGDGTELYFMTWNREPEQMMAVDIRTAGSAIQAGTPRALFATDYIDYHGSVWNWHAYAVSRDGQRFLIPRHNISGTWKVTSGNTSYALVLAQNGSKLTGAVRGCGASSAVEISEGVVQMDKISFKCRSGNGTIITYTGVNRGNPGIEFTTEGGKFTVDRVSEGTEPELERMARTSR